MKKPKKTRIGITFTQPYIDALDTLVERGLFIDRQDMIREALRSLFMKHGLEPFTDQRDPRIIERQEVKKP